MATDREAKAFLSLPPAHYSTCSLPTKKTSGWILLGRSAEPSNASMSSWSTARSLASTAAVSARVKAQLLVSDGNYCTLSFVDPWAVLAGTALVALVSRRDVHVACVGDSRCVLGKRASSSTGEVWHASDLSIDQKPDSPGEYERLKRAGALLVRMQVIDARSRTLVARHASDHASSDMSSLS